MAQTRLSRRERLKQTQRNAIIEAAEAVFAEQGFHKAKMEDIARRADFATGSLYNYFRSKNAIFAALWQKRISMLYDRLIEALDDRLSFTELIQRLAAVHLSFMDRHRSFFDLFLAVGHRSAPALPMGMGKETVLQYDRYVKLVEHIIEKGIAEGLLRPVHVQASAQAFLAAMNALVFYWSANNPTKSFARRFPEVLDLFFFGMASDRSLSVDVSTWASDRLERPATLASLRAPTDRTVSAILRGIDSSTKTANAADTASKKLNRSSKAVKAPAKDGKGNQDNGRSTP